MVVVLVDCENGFGNVFEYEPKFLVVVLDKVLVVCAKTVTESKGRSRGRKSESRRVTPRNETCVKTSPFAWLQSQPVSRQNLHLLVVVKRQGRVDKQCRNVDRRSRRRKMRQSRLL